MSAQQRKLQDLKVKQGFSTFHRSAKQLVPIQQSLKTLPDVNLSPLEENKWQKLQTITSIYKSPQRSMKIIGKRTSIQRVSISQQLKNLVKFKSQLQLDGLDAIKNQLKSTDTVVTQLQRAQNTDIFLASIADGHGPQGLQISQLITHLVMSEMRNLINTTPIVGLSLMISQSFSKLFQNAEQNMLEQTDIDVTSNGSSLLSLVVINNTIYCANLGDSKAAYFYKKDIDPLGPKEVRMFAQKNLNLVHDTNNSKEVQRILNKGGKIDQALYKGSKSGSLKIWVPKKNYPGIKITRCVGNTIGKMIGISAEPEITEFKVPKSGFLMIGTTGFWEKMDILMIDQILDAHFPPSCQEDLDKVLKEIGNEIKKYWDPSCEGLVDVSLVLIYIDIN